LLKFFPQYIIGRRAIKRDNAAVPQIFIKWTNLSEEDASWEDYDSIKLHFQNTILEDRNSVEEEAMSEPGILTLDVEEENKKEVSKGKLRFSHGHEIIKRDEEVRQIHCSNMLPGRSLNGSPICRKSNGSHLNMTDVACRDNSKLDLAKFLM
jgi:Chromo (CHRromatin Organisation MOdifier) domain